MRITSPRSVRHKAFRDMIGTDIVEDIVATAALAPCGMGARSWIFDTRHDVVRILRDARQKIDGYPTDRRNEVIACGSALMCLRIAAARYGLQIDGGLVINPDAPDLIAQARIVTGTPDDLRFLEQGKRSLTIGVKAFRPERPEPDVLKTLRSGAASENVWLEELDGPNRKTVGALVAQAGAIRRIDLSWQSAAARAPGPMDRTGDVGAPSPAAFGTRRLPPGFGQVARKNLRACDIAETAPLLVVVGTGLDRPDDWLRTGQALERLFLTAAQRGLLTLPCNRPIGVPHLRKRLQSLCKAQGVAQSLLCLGYPDPDHTVQRSAGATDAEPRFNGLHVPREFG